MEKLSASAVLEELTEIREREREALELAGISRLNNLLDWLPKRYEDRRRFDAFPVQAGGGGVCLRGLVIDTQRRSFNGKSFYEAIIEEANQIGMGRVTCRWFNMPFMQKILAAGHEVIIYGKPKESQGRVVIDHPEFEVVREDGEVGIHLERLVPIYRNVNGLAQRRLREIIHAALGAVDTESLEVEYVVDATYPRGEAYRELHFPDEMAQADAARRFFALEEFFLQQMRVLWRKREWLSHDGRVLGKKTALLTAFYESLPFDLTEAQKRTVREIVRDMREPHAMNRLLQGDVGSGKTFVAMCAMLLAVDSGAQAALMAPTQILAEQHYLTFSKWLEPLGVRVALVTADREEGTSLELGGEAQIIIGTHALLYGKVTFRDLGLVVVDEQHKFGVQQRASLIKRGVLPDVLVMTATPIPRTLTMTIYGDLDVSILDELPAGRGKIITGVRVKPALTDLKNFLKAELEKGRQLYLVYPLVEESESVKAASAVAEFEKWQKRLGPHSVALLHGKMSADEKESVMRAFREGETRVLVSTSVIEVGVDVPNANVMIIFNAERFGLAQLHQLRGRIGRGEHKSYCVLVTDGKNAESTAKLEILAATRDGFKIADEDLKIRGPGEVLGTRQSGMSEFRFIEFLNDYELLHEARALAEKVSSADPDLEKCPRLREFVEAGMNEPDLEKA